MYKNAFDLNEKSISFHSITKTIYRTCKILKLNAIF